MDYEQKLLREQAWYKEGGLKRHFLNSWVFYSPQRTAFSATYCKNKFAAYVGDFLARDHLKDPRILIAPTGAGNDLPYLEPLSTRLTGIDVSPAALAAIPDGRIEKYLGDIKKMTMFADNQFDAVIMSQFFHHFVKFGLDDFLIEARRVLRPGGHFFSVEPSILHPFAAVAWCAKKLFGQFTGCVEDESPFYPARLLRAMRRCGFRKVTFCALSYSHQRMPIPLARLIHATVNRFPEIPVLRYCGWACAFHGSKP